MKDNENKLRRTKEAIETIVAVIMPESELKIKNKTPMYGSWTDEEADKDSFMIMMNHLYGLLR